MLDRLKYAITHPVTVTTGALSGISAVLASIFQIPILSDLWGWLLAFAPEMFSFASIFGRFVAPGLEAVPAEPFLWAAGGFGLIYGGGKLWSALQGLRRSVSE